ncbi:hypothetical protein A5707_11385 [Mycobacterium kyorinense]|uniref:Uncharacterized protein n=1 Tax=Mycobacterium kyorinense TaxID=487514 RepID=A0A1A2ZUU1_9MYCO|nr:hypothetical protein [Mycobacterium kyorinense]OBI53468.1 hypothetical protein A5707_11385 [Mycobacterium kyorinense]
MAERRVKGPAFPPELRAPFGSRFAWHEARARWLRANGLKGVLVEVRAMTDADLSRKLEADPLYRWGA